MLRCNMARDRIASGDKSSAQMADQKHSNEFETFQDLNRAFWENWLETGTEAFQEGAGAASKAWSEAADAWQALLPQDGGMPGPAHVMDALTRQGQAFLALGESVAEAGNDVDLSEWLDRWLDAVSGANVPSFHAFAMPAEGLKGLTPPGAAMDPARLLTMPTLGYSREHQAAQQRLMRTQLEFQQANAQYNAQLEKALRDAAGRFRDRLTQAAEPGQQINSLRDLYDLWVDVAEEAFAEVAFSQEFRQVYGQLVNSLMRSRRAYLEAVEPLMQTMGVPTRGELDDTSRQLHELRREVADLKARMSSPAATAEEPDRETAAGRAARGKATRRKAPAGKTARKKVGKKAGKKASTKRGQSK